MPDFNRRKSQEGQGDYQKNDRSQGAPSSAMKMGGSSPRLSKTAEKSDANPMGTLPVGRLLVKMSLPMMVSFFIQAMYNIVDSIFVAQISENALTAVSLAFPMQQLVHAIAVGLGVGINAAVAKHIGMRDERGAARTVGAAIAMDLIVWAVFFLLGIFAAGPIYQAQTDVAEIVEGGTIYLKICWCVVCGDLFGQVFEKMLVSSGRPTMAMLSQAIGAVFNIVFDPLLIFGIGPFPKMGIAGAATATVLGQILGAGVALSLNLKKNTSVRVHLTDINLAGKNVKEVFSVGFPSMITIGLTSVTSFCINQILLSYSTTATAVYGIWVKLQNFCFMPLFGMNNGMVPILSYNHATKRDDRVWTTVRLAVLTDLVLMVALAIVLEFIPVPLLRLFNASENMLSIGTVALRTCILSLPFGGLCIILTTTMQSLEHSRYTLLVNIMRQLVFITVMFALISALTHQLNQVWIAVPVAEIMSAILAIVMELKMRRDLSRQET